MDAEQKALIDLQKRISEVLSDMEQDIRANELIPNRIGLPLITKLRAVNNVMDPRRRFVCYVIGNTNTGKSSLINQICGKKVCEVSEDDEHGTRNFQRIDEPQVNATFIDTVGFGSNDDTVLLKKMEEDFATTSATLDVILLVVTKGNIRDQAALKRITEAVNNILKWLREKRCQIEVPVVCVLNKIDEYFDGAMPSLEDAEEIDGYLTNAVKRVNQYLCTEVKQSIAVSSKYRYNIDLLLTILQQNSPLSAQIIQNRHRYWAECRKTMAGKIINGSIVASAAISMLPLVDIVIVSLLEEWMFKILACFSVDLSRTVDMFRKENSNQRMVHSTLRIGLLLHGDDLELTGISYLAAFGISVTAASLKTAKIGWSCYRYLTEE